MYLEIDEGFIGHRKTIRFCSMMQDPNAFAFIIRLWSWACRSQPDGVLEGMDAGEVEMASGYTHHDGRCYAAMVKAGFIDETAPGAPGALHGWSERTGEAIRRMATKAKTVREWRDHKNRRCVPERCRYCGDDSSTVSGNRTSTVPVPNGHGSTQTRNGTGDVPHRQVQSSPVQSRPVKSSTDPDPEAGASEIGAGSNQAAPASRKWTGYDLKQRFGQLRQEIIGGLPWSAPRDAQGQAESMAAGLSEEEADDVVPTMRLLLTRIHEGAKGYTETRLKDPSFAFGAWRSRFTALREELHKVAPPDEPPDRGMVEIDMGNLPP